MFRAMPPPLPMPDFGSSSTRFRGTRERCTEGLGALSRGFWPRARKTGPCEPGGETCHVKGPSTQGGTE